MSAHSAPRPPDSRPGPRIVLASASPRRHRLLRDAGLAFDVEPADVDETIDLALDAGAVAEDLARRKALTVAARRSAAGPREAILVIGSDTIVVLGEDGDPGRAFLEKAADGAEAAEMLGRLSGTRHRVITGVAVARVEPGGAAGPVRCAHETTFVTMRPLSGAEIEAYVASDEWRGKAGAYAIQETADRFVSALDGGGFDNVVGLPVQLTLQLLRDPGPPEVAPGP